MSQYKYTSTPFRDAEIRRVDGSVHHNTNHEHISHNRRVTVHLGYYSATVRGIPSSEMAPKIVCWHYKLLRENTESRRNEYRENYLL